MKKQNKHQIAGVVAIQNKLPAGLISMLWILDTMGNLGGMAGWAVQTIRQLA